MNNLSFRFKGNSQDLVRTASYQPGPPASRRRIRHSVLFAITWVLLLGSATPGFSQQLNVQLCPGNQANYASGLARFNVGDPGTPLLKRTLLGPQSRCNDGSPGVMYIRRGQNADTTKWVIHFQGGGSCNGQDACYDRWCSTAPNPAVFDKAGKMSSLGTPEAISRGGIFSQAPADSNAFAHYNQAFLYYCSSDTWIGSANRGVPIDPTTGNPVTYEIEFQGEAIVNDAIATLRDGPTYADPIPMGLFPGLPLPDLDDADEVIFTGSSAGGAGLRHHIDRLREVLVANNIDSVYVAAVVDAGLPPVLSHPSIVWGMGAAPAGYAALLTLREPVNRDLWGMDKSALDASCLKPMFMGAHNAVGIHPQICNDATYTLLHHITTPFFVRMDLHDPLPMSRYVNNMQFLPNNFDFARATARQLTGLPTLTRLEPYLRAPGAFGSNCGLHISLSKTRHFLGDGVRQPGGVKGTSFHDLLFNWLYGGGPSGEVQKDNPLGPPYTSSFCPL